MEAVWHDPLSVAVFVKELVVEIDPDDLFAVRVCLDDFVDFIVFGAPPVFGVAARENRKENDFRLGLLLSEQIKERADAERDLFGSVAAAVVRADHKHYALGLVSVQFAVKTAPQQVLRSVAAVADVEDAVFLKKFCVFLFALKAP